MMAGRFARILNILKKWLSRLARRSAGLFFVALSSLRRFAAGLLSLSNRKLITRFPSGVRPRSQEDIVAEDSPICPSLLPPGQMGLEVAGEPSSPSDDPYTGTHSRPSRPLRKGTAIPPLEVPSTTTGYTSATETDGLHQGSVSSLHLSLEMGESSVNNRMLLTDGPLQESSSPGPSRLVGPHEVSTGHSRQSGYMDDARSVNTTRTPSMRHLAPSMSRSQHASESRVSISSNRSLTRSIAGSESRQAAYRPHKGPVHSRPASVHGSTAYHGSPNTISVPLDLPVQALPVSDSGYDHYVHYTAPPGNNELPGSEVVVVYGAQYDAPLTSCMVANDVRRYGRCSPRDPKVHDITVPAMSLTAHDMPIPEGWTTFVHPEGARYYVNQEKRTFTEMDIRQEDIGKDIEYYMVYLLEELRQTLEQRGIVLDMSQIDLVVEPKVYEVDGESVVCCYYFANHHDRCLFWLDDFNPEDIISECKGVENLSHARLAIEAQYWRHWDYFPSLCPVTQNIVDELKGVLMHAACDHLTSMQSSLPFDATELKDHLSVVDRIKVHPIPPADQIMQQGHAAISTSPAAQSMRLGHAAIVIGRLMYTFTHNHFVNYHGEDCVRLMYEQTVHGWEYQPSAFMFILAPLLFFDPVAQIQELHKIFVDEVACTTRWNLFCAKFKGQLQDSNLLATVLLNANVGFLAINTVDRGGRNAIQMASYMSLVTSLGSIVLGLFFVSHDRTSGTNTATEAAVFLARLHNNKHGMEKLAIIYSLPKALLMWGMAFFFAAFSIDWWTSGDAISKTIVGTVTVAVFVMIANSIIRTRARTKWSLRPTWLRASIDLKLLSGLVNARRDAMEFMRMKIGLSQANPGGDVQMHSTSQSTLATGFQPEMPGHNNHPYPPYPPVQPYHSTASVHSQQPHDGNSVLPSLDPHIGPGVLSGAGALQQIQEDIPTDFQDQSTTEARCEPHSALLAGHFNTSPSSASEEITSTAANAICHSDALPTTATILPEHELQTAAVADTDAPIPAGPLCTEEREGVTYTENVVEEPGELEHRQPSPSPLPLPNEVPRIIARGATGDEFQHAPAAPRWTLPEGQDILEEGPDILEEPQE